MRIVFMGTPDFAVPSLEALSKNFDIVGVVTAADKPSGRGLQVHESAVKKFAVANSLKILQPVKLRDENFLTELRSLNADLFVVVAFRMLPEVVWNMPPKGTINLHASLLPDYRGAAPINWVIMNGEKETGLTTFFLQQEIDTGNIILQKKLPIADNETAGELHDRMMAEGAGVLLETVRLIESGKAHPIPQQKSEIEKKAPKIFKEDCEINWNKTVEEIYNFIRGLSPYPTAWTKLNGLVLKIFLAEKILSPQTQRVGTVSNDNKTFLRFACKDGWIDLKEIQLEGKKRMGIQEFLRGYRIN